MHLVFLSVFLALFVKINEGADWCYQSQFTCESHCKAPDHWSEAEHAQSCSGKSQSPINIVTKRTLPDERLTPFKFTGYQDTFNSNIKNNGHSVAVAVPHVATVSDGDLKTTYKAVQFHLHWGTDGGPGSEHTVDGEQYPMELHIVHIKKSHTSLSSALQDPTGVAVLGFFYEESASANRKYEPLINALRKIKTTGANTTINGLSLNALLPSPKNMTSYYRYKGSLTTPGCTEAVVWTVFEHAIPLSRDQLRAFSELQFHDGKKMVGTFRPVQPLNGRKVYRSAGSVVLASGALLAISVAAAFGLSRPN
ncbi:carbonic anhydrase 4a [Megalops cyprinoides]|uniref:carbonic anhydrase 4a n=1 Tax=Megalops cyprinoides TaxID=118141 RepID=UPI001863C971|nr:carbonic anhydrase 4a [Megalops cyprinoides]